MDPKPPQTPPKDITPQPTYDKQLPHTPPEQKQSLWERRPQALTGEDPPPLYPAELHSQNPTKNQHQNPTQTHQYQSQQQPKAYNQNETMQANRGQQGNQGQTVIYVQREDHRKDDVALGCCAGCGAACCCCGCVVM